MPLSRRGIFLFLLVSIPLGSGGCVTAGLAAVGPVVGSLTALGDRRVERTMPTDLSTAWGATVDALARMAVRVQQTEKSGSRWELTGGDGTVTVYGTLERVTARMTKVSVRVEAGSIFADKRTGEELLNQISSSLVTLTGPGPYDPAAAAEASAAQFGALRRAIERLDTKVEEARDGRDARPPGAGSGISAPVVTVATSPIITVPTSAGVATTPGPLPLPPALAQERPAPATVPPRRLPDRREGALDEIVARPLTSVEVLQPVEGLSIRPAGK